MKNKFLCFAVLFLYWQVVPISKAFPFLSEYYGNCKKYGNGGN